MCLFKSFEVGCISKSINLQRKSWLKVASLPYVLDIYWPYSGLCKTMHNLRINLGNLQKVMLCLLHFFLFYCSQGFYLIQFIEVSETVFRVDSEFLISASIIENFLAGFRSSYICLFAAIKATILYSPQICFGQIAYKRMIRQLGRPIFEVSFIDLFSSQVIAKENAVFKLTFVTYWHLRPFSVTHLAILLLLSAALHA